MAFGIWAGALTFDVVREMVAPVLPFDDGDRIVGLRLVDLDEGQPGAPSLEHFTTWREELQSITGLSAFRTASHNVIVDGGTAEPIQVAEISAAGFAVARVAPLLGRTLVGADEGAGAPPVAIIGHDLWQSSFTGDPDIIGKTVGIGGSTSTIAASLSRRRRGLRSLPA